MSEFLNVGRLWLNSALTSNSGSSVTYKNKITAGVGLINRSEDILHFDLNGSGSDITTLVYSSRCCGSTPDSLAGSEQPGIMFSLSFQLKQW